MNAYKNTTDPFYVIYDYQCTGIGKICYKNLTGILYNTLTTPAGSGNPLLILRIYKNRVRTDDLILIEHKEDLPYSVTTTECSIGDSMNFTIVTHAQTNGFFKDAVVVHDIYKTVKQYAADSNGKIRLINKYDSSFLLNKYARTNSLFPAVIDKSFEFDQSVRVHTASRFKNFGIDSNVLRIYGYDTVYYDPFGNETEMRKSIDDFKPVHSYNIDTTIVSLDLPVVVKGERIKFRNSQIIIDKQTEEVIYADIRDKFKTVLPGIYIGMDLKTFYDKIFGFYNESFVKFKQLKFDTGYLDNSLNFYFSNNRLVRMEFKNYTY